MRRREFIALICGTAAAWPFAARAQRPALPVIGFLNLGTPEGYADMVAAFEQGLKDVGYIAGENVAIEFRWAGGQRDRLPALAADLVRLNVAVIVGNSSPALAAKRATTTIPIVFSAPGDPVEAGLVASFNRPGGNVTGVSSLGAELSPKRLQVLHELLPAVTSMAALINPSGPTAENQSRDLQAAASVLGLQLHVLPTPTEREFDSALASARQAYADALVISADPLFNAWSEQLAALAVRYAMPTIYQYREFAAAGGLISYGGSIKDVYRLVGVYAGRILKGEKPADLPVQQSTKIELVINAKTAKSLGISIPLSLLGRADEVIE
jgi:putative tryptophan/tyrosine transport system substrate-binding protein